MKISNLEKKIEKKEGFAVKFYYNDRNVRDDCDIPTNYEFSYKAKDNMTVNEWIQKRFSSKFPGFKAKVLMGNGKPASGNAKLSTVRESY